MQEVKGQVKGSQFEMFGNLGNSRLQQVDEKRGELAQMNQRGEAIQDLAKQTTSNIINLVAQKQKAEFDEGVYFYGKDFNARQQELQLKYEDDPTSDEYLKESEANFNRYKEMVKSSSSDFFIEKTTSNFFNQLDLKRKDSDIMWQMKQQNQNIIKRAGQMIEEENIDAFNLGKSNNINAFKEKIEISDGMMKEMFSNMYGLENYTPEQYSKMSLQEQKDYDTKLLERDKFIKEQKELVKKSFINKYIEGAIRSNNPQEARNFLNANKSYFDAKQYESYNSAIGNAIVGAQTWYDNNQKLAKNYNYQNLVSGLINNTKGNNDILEYLAKNPQIEPKEIDYLYQVRDEVLRSGLKISGGRGGGRSGGKEKIDDYANLFTDETLETNKKGNKSNFDFAIKELGLKGDEVEKIKNFKELDELEYGKLSTDEKDAYDRDFSVVSEIRDLMLEHGNVSKDNAKALALIELDLAYNKLYVLNDNDASVNFKEQDGMNDYFEKLAKFQKAGLLSESDNRKYIEQGNVSEILLNTQYKDMGFWNNGWKKLKNFFTSDAEAGQEKGINYINSGKVLTDDDVVEFAKQRYSKEYKSIVADVNGKRLDDDSLKGQNFIVEIAKRNGSFAITLNNWNKSYENNFTSIVEKRVREENGGLFNDELKIKYLDKVKSNEYDKLKLLNEAKTLTQMQDMVQGGININDLKNELENKKLNMDDVYNQYLKNRDYDRNMQDIKRNVNKSLNSLKLW